MDREEVGNGEEKGGEVLRQTTKMEKTANEGDAGSIPKRGNDEWEL